MSNRKNFGRVDRVKKEAKKSDKQPKTFWERVKILVDAATAIANFFKMMDL